MDSNLAGDLVDAVYGELGESLSYEASVDRVTAVLSRRYHTNDDPETTRLKSVISRARALLSDL